MKVKLNEKGEKTICNGITQESEAPNEVEKADADADDRKALL